MISRLKMIFNNKNNKIILENVLGAFLVKGGALIVSFFTMPAYIRYFDNQLVLGLWFTVLSVLTWILTFDFGIGNGLRNHLVKALVNKDNVLAKKYISSAYFLIGSLACVVLIVSIIPLNIINWNKVFNVSKDIISNQTLSTTVIIIFTSIVLQLFLKLITSILYALQRSALNNFLHLVSSIIILIYVSNADGTDLSARLITLAIIYGLAVNIPLLFTTVLVFATKLRDSRPNIKYVGRKYGSEIIKLGGLFLWVQIMYMILSMTNDILISWFVGPEKVVDYQIYNRIFSLIGTLFTLGLIPIWSAVTKVINENNFRWIKKLYNILMVISVLVMISEFILIIFLQSIFDLWLGENSITVNYNYAVIFAISGSIFIWIGVLSSIANGLGKLKIQITYFTIGAILKVPISWFLVMIFDSWIGVILANIIALSMFCIIQPVWLNKYLNKLISSEKSTV